MRSLNAAQLPWLEVRKEMAEEKGLDPTVADKIGDLRETEGYRPYQTYFSQACDRRLGRRRTRTSPDAGRRYYAASAKEGISEMGILFRQLDVYRVTPYVSHAPLIH